MSLPELDIFTWAYVECALWSEIDDNERALDENYDPEDIHWDTLVKMIHDCTMFQRENAEDISDESRHAGHDFWLTRNGHGAGFWDGDWPEEAGERLTKASKAYGEVYLYVADGKVCHG